MISKIQSIQHSKFKITDSVKLESGVTVPCITGQVGQVEVVSQNGYRYRQGFWDKVVSDPLVQNDVKNRNYLGTIEHPQDDEEYLSTPYQKASHVLIKLWVQDHNPYAVFGLLNNPNGNAIKALVDVGHQPGVSTRGLGNFDQDTISQYVCEDGYCFRGFDIVRNPNFSDLKLTPVSDALRANPLFQELVQSHQLKDGPSQDYDRAKLLSDISKLADELRQGLSKLHDCIFN